MSLYYLFKPRFLHCIYKCVLSETEVVRCQGALLMVGACLPRLWACWVRALRAPTEQAQTWRPDLGDALRASPKPALAIGAAPLHRGPRAPTSPADLT